VNGVNRPGLHRAATGIAASETGRKPLSAIYDLGWYAPTFNIFEFLTGARIWARSNGFDGLKLIVLRRPFQQAPVKQPQAPSEYDFRVHDIVLAAANLFPLDQVELTSDLAVAGEAVSRGAAFPPCWNPVLSRGELDAHRYFLQRYLRDQVAAGQVLPGIRVPVFAYRCLRSQLEKHPRPWVSISIRQALHLPAKNSSLRTWQAIAGRFRSAGASVFLIPDIETIAQFGEPDSISAMAAANLSYRSALYDACDLNLAVANGAVAPMWFNPSAVFVIAKFATEGTNTSRKSLEELSGLRPGVGLWNGVAWQRALWCDDDDPDPIIAEAGQVLELSAALRRHAAGNPIVSDPWGKPDGTLRDLWRWVRPGMSDTEIEHSMRTSVCTAESFRTVRETCPFSVKAWILESEEHLAKGRFGDALAAAKQAIRLDGRYPRPHMIAALCLEHAGQRDLAQRYLIDAHRL
jgi:hypothetical protein